MRADYIEPDYVNGVRNENGEMVIRPLNAEEKKFLNQFYEEVIGANFLHSPEMKEVKARMKEIEGLTNPTDEELDEFMHLQAEYFKLADDILFYTKDKDQKKIYGENNARNRCIYNRSKASGGLLSLNPEIYDEDEDSSPYYDPETGEYTYLDETDRKRKEKDNGSC
jgi:hypothetical protein